MPFAEVCPPGSVAVITDVHPDEWTSEPGYDLYELLDRERIPGVWAVRGNELTWHNNRETGSAERYTDINLQHVDDTYAIAHPAAYEVRRKPELTVATAAARLVIHTHSVRGSGVAGSETYAWHNPNASDLIRGLAGYIGIRKGVYMAPTNIGYGDPRHCMLDFAPQDADKYLDTMYDLLGKLAARVPLMEGDINEYRFLTDVMLADARRVGLPDEHPAWEPFSEADQQKLGKLGMPPGVVSTGWSYADYGSRIGIMGELVVPAHM